ncbi:MAG TPA: aldo/keto reductase, partial [Armatimonadota bacterium]|nr:aldo/keto reductase [Armatimonadota bacterium]
HPWVQIIMVRLNYAGEHMDVSPDQVLPVLRQAHAAGKGIFGMKVLGQGALAQDPERGLRYILAQECVDAFSIGMMNQEQVDQNVALVGED